MQGSRNCWWDEQYQKQPHQRQIAPYRITLDEHPYLKSGYVTVLRIGESLLIPAQRLREEEDPIQQAQVVERVPGLQSAPEAGRQVETGHRFAHTSPLVFVRYRLKADCIRRNGRPLLLRTRSSISPSLKCTGVPLSRC